MSNLLLFALTAIIVGIIVKATTFRRITRDGKPLRFAPDTLPLVGNGILFLQDRHKLFSWFVKCERLFGLETFAITVPSLPPGVVINDPKNLEFVLKNEDIFSKGSFFKVRSWDLFGNGIINTDGESWRLQRKAGLHFLSANNLKILTENALPKYLKDATNKLTASDGSTVDLAEIFLELTTQLMGQMAYGMDMHADDDFTKAFEYASGKTGERFQNPFWMITELFSGHRFRQAISQVKAYGDSIVTHAIASRTSKRPSETTSRYEEISGSLIYSLLDALDDTQVVADAALNYLSAGRDTTAEALTWAFYLLMRTPEAFAQLRKEVDLDMELTANAQPYAMAVFYETLRLYPPVPFEIKQCEQVAILPDGTHLPRSAVVFWSIWALNRSQASWGSDSDLFRPERWLHEGKFVSRTAFEFPVFNGGTRMCLGKKMAESIALSVIVNLVKHFEFRNTDERERVSKNSLTLPMEGGLPCTVMKRRS